MGDIEQRRDPISAQATAVSRLIFFFMTGFRILITHFSPGRQGTFMRHTRCIEARLAGMTRRGPNPPPDLPTLMLNEKRRAACGASTLNCTSSQKEGKRTNESPTPRNDCSISHPSLAQRCNTRGKHVGGMRPVVALMPSNTSLYLPLPTFRETS